MSNDNVKKMPPGKPPQEMQAMVIPVPLFMQMVEAIRGSVCHRDAEPIMQQIAPLQPQSVHFNQGD